MQKTKLTLLQQIEESAAFARVELGMLRAEFDAHTPVQFDLIVRHWKNKVYREDCRTALIRFTIASAAGCKTEDGESVKIGDFLPPHPEKKQRKKRKPKFTLERFLAGLGNIQVIDTRKKPNGD